MSTGKGKHDFRYDCLNEGTGYVEIEFAFVYPYRGDGEVKIPRHMIAGLAVYSFQ